MNQRFLQTSLRFYSALAIREPQIYVVVEQFEAENVSLLRGRLVKKTTPQINFPNVTQLAKCNSTPKMVPTIVQ